jgi:hypothetical protein
MAFSAFHKVLRHQQGASDLKNTQGLKVQDQYAHGYESLVWGASMIASNVYWTGVGFAAISSSGTVAFSADGITWEAIDGVLNYGDQVARYIAYYNNKLDSNRRLISVSTNGFGYSSLDGGRTWPVGANDSNLTAATGVNPTVRNRDVFWLESSSRWVVGGTTEWRRSTTMADPTSQIVWEPRQSDPLKSEYETMEYGGNKNWTMGSGSIIVRANSGNDALSFVSVDSGTTWAKTRIPVSFSGATSTYSLPINQKTGELSVLTKTAAAAGSSQSMSSGATVVNFTKTTNGTDWYQRCLSADAYSIVSNGTKVLIGTGTGALYSSPANDGQTWKYEPGHQGNRISKAGSEAAIGQIAISGNTIVAQTTDLNYSSSGPIICSTNGGTTWQLAKSSTLPADGLRDLITQNRNIGALFHDGTRFWSLNVGQPYLTSTDGLLWTVDTFNQGGTAAGNAGWGSVNRIRMAYAAVGGGTHVVVGNEGGRPRVAYARASTWTWNNHTSVGNLTGWGNTGNSDTFRAGGIYCITWSGTYFIIGGDNGKIATSTDGIIWNVPGGGDARKLTGGTGAAGLWGSTFNSVLGIAANGNTVVALGGTVQTGGTNTINETAAEHKLARSTDGGSTWAAVTKPAGWTYISSIIYANSRFVITSFYGQIATSPDGLTWTNQPQLATTQWGTASMGTSIAYGATTGFVVGGQYGRIAKSVDAATWTYIADDPLLSSYDWQASVASFNQPRFDVMDIVWGNNQFVSVGRGGRVATSPDGVTWTLRETLGRKNRYLSNIFSGATMITPAGLIAIAWGNGTYVAGGTGGTIYTSPNGITWTLRSQYDPTTLPVPPLTGEILSIVFDGSRFVALSLSKELASSPDGITWSPVTGAGGTTSTSWFPAGQGIAAAAITSAKLLYAGGRYVCVATQNSGGYVNLTTTTLGNTTWTQLSGFSAATSLSTAMQGGSDIPKSVAIAYGNNTYVAVSWTGGIAKSSDGLNWTNVAPDKFFVDGTVVTWTGSKFVAAGLYGRTATSVDGTTWVYDKQLVDIFSEISNPGNANRLWTRFKVTDMCWTGTQFIAVGETGIVATSPDGFAWTDRPSLRNLPDWNYRSLTTGTDYVSNATVVGGNAAASKHVIIGENGACAHSTDGITWTYTDSLSQTYWTRRDCNVILWDGLPNGSVVIAGDRGKAGVMNNGPFNLKSNNIPTGGYINHFLFISSVGNHRNAGGFWQGGKGGLLNCGWGIGNDVYAGCWDGTKFIVVGAGGRVATSFTDSDTSGNYSAFHPLNGASTPSGRSWNFQTGLRTGTWGTTDSVRALHRRSDTGLIVVVGDNGKAATTTDGIAWTYRAGLQSSGWGSASSARAITWSGTQYVTVGDNGKVATSPDGIVWTNQTGLSSTSWGTTTARVVAYNTGNNNIYVVAGDNGKLATSEDGITWTARVLPADWGTARVRCILWNGTNFIIGGDNGKLATSANGIDWVFSSAFIDRYKNDSANVVTNYGITKSIGGGKDVPITSLAFINNRIIIGTGTHPGFDTKHIMSNSSY